MDKLDEIAYIKVKTRPPPLLWTLDGYSHAPSTFVHPSDIEVVRKRDLAWVREAQIPLHIPAGLYYNENIDSADTMIQDQGGNWLWTSSPEPEYRQPTVWKCRQCAMYRVMDCSCSTETSGNGWIRRTLSEKESPCIHRSQDPQFVCRACRGNDDRQPWGINAKSPGRTSKA